MSEDGRNRPDVTPAPAAAQAAGPQGPADASPSDRTPSPEARRALAEAAARRAEIDARAAERGRDEQGGRGGLEPTRFGDWEVEGRAVDF